MILVLSNATPIKINGWTLFENGYKLKVQYYLIISLFIMIKIEEKK